MKYTNKYIRLLASGTLLLLVLFACTKFEEFSSKNPTMGAPTVSLSIATVEDSSVVVSASSNMEGYLALYILSGADTNIYNRVDVLTNNIPAESVVANSSAEVAANESVAVAFNGALIQNTSYKALAVANNPEGNTSELTELTFNTSDSYGPLLDSASVSPAMSNVPAQPADFSVVIPFNEPIKLANASKISFGYLSFVDYTTTWVPTSADDIVVDNSTYTVTISQSATPENGQYVFLTIEEGAITDIIGNNFAGIEGGVDLGEGVLYGLFWRTEHINLDPTIESPTLGEAQTEPGFDIVISFTEDMELGADFTADVLGETGSVMITYLLAPESASAYVIVEDSIEIDGSTITIKQLITPIPGTEIYLSILEGAFEDINGNINSEFVMEVGGDDGWLISKGLTVDMIVGDYEATCISGFDESVYTQNITIEADPDVENGVILSGFEGSDSLIYGTLDGVWGQISIPSDQSLGDLIGDGSEVFMFNYDLDASVELPIVGTVLSNGNISCPFGSYIVGGAYDGYSYDIYKSSIWVKQTDPGKFPSHSITPRVIDSSRKLTTR